MAIPNSYDILQAVIEATPDAIFVKDLDGRYVVVNQAMARFLGRPAAEIIGKRDVELYPEETARMFVAADQQVLASGEAGLFEGIAKTDTKTQAFLVTKGVYRDKDGRILGLYGISHDITELRKAQESLERTREALFQAQKMEAVGQLTGGIAHDFSNILSVVLGNIELLRLHLQHDAHARELIETVQRAAMHAQNLTTDLLGFSRRRQLNPQPIDVNTLIDGIVRLLRRTLSAKIHIETSTIEGTLVAMVDPAALEAALLNVALNSRDAMPDGGRLIIRTSTVEIVSPANTEDDLTQGGYAVLALEDTGAGMTPDVVARVFEPFFTTKRSSEGTGLGLSMVYGFAKQSGGAVTITSQPGRGTTVTLFLPLSGNQPRPAKEHAPAIETPAVSRTILVIEDEAAVRNTVRRQLEHLGHRVIVTSDADEARTVLSERTDIDVLLTDVVLGTGMNGIDIAEEARKRYPRLGVIFMSGYAAVTDAQERMRGTAAPFLPKPASMAQLQRAINAVSEHRVR